MTLACVKGDAGPSREQDNPEGGKHSTWAPSAALHFNGSHQWELLTYSERRELNDAASSVRRHANVTLAGAVGLKKEARNALSELPFLNCTLAKQTLKNTPGFCAFPALPAVASISFRATSQGHFRRVFAIN